MNPPAPAISPGESVAVRVTSESPKLDLSQTVQWSITPSDVAILDPKPRRDGRVSFTGLKEGVATIRATDPSTGTFKETTLRVDKSCNQTYLQVGRVTLDGALHDGKLDGEGLGIHATTAISYARYNFRGEQLFRMGLGVGSPDLANSAPKARMAGPYSDFPISNYTSQLLLSEDGPTYSLPAGLKADQAIAITPDRFIVLATRYQNASIERILLDIDRTRQPNLIERTAYDPVERSLSYDTVRQVLFYGSFRYDVSLGGFTALASWYGDSRQAPLHCFRPGEGWIIGPDFSVPAFSYYTSTTSILLSGG